MRPTAPQLFGICSILRWPFSAKRPLSSVELLKSEGAQPKQTQRIERNATRSPSELAQRVQRRVQERNQFTVHGQATRSFPSTVELLQFLATAIPQYLTFRPPDNLDDVFPVQRLDYDLLSRPVPPTGMRLSWLGHSGLLLQLHGTVTILTDPVFSQRCAPTQYFGPARFRPPPGTIAELLQGLSLDLVLISHNHYDHLDANTVRDIHRLSPDTSFVVPLGLQSWFRQNVGHNVNVYEMDWHESMVYETTQSTVNVTCVPSRHWTNRTGDRDQTLWCGYSIENESNKKFLFPGDTAWFDGLHQLGEQYGPWDVAAIPIGAYEPREFMKYNHINVQEAIAMKDAVLAKQAVPIHWGTFPLTFEPVLEPREKLLSLMKGRPDESSFVPWCVGETKTF